METDDPHVRLTREIGDFVPYLERSCPCTRLLLSRTAAVLAAVFRHRNQDKRAKNDEKEETQR